MEKRNVACLTAAALLGAALTAGATQALAAPPLGDVVIKADRFDPELQRRVSYADLNLATKQGRHILDGRIFRTASNLCWELNGFDTDKCTDEAIESTDDQVALAVQRAKRRLAGLPVGPAVAITMVIGH